MLVDRTFELNKNIKIKNAILLAPMEGITDLPFRLLCKELGADIVYTEFVASEALIRDVQKSFNKMLIDKKERPVAIQIFGSNPKVMAEAAKIAEEEGADIVDINYGCWVKKVVNNNAGAALMKNPELMAEITNECSASVKIPVTIKTRLGWDKKSINIFEIAKLQEKAGAKAITVHCRTRDMKITGKADWTFIPKIKKEISIPLVLNGDISSPQVALEAIKTEGADAIMIGRAAVGNPFIFSEAKYLFENGEEMPPATIQKRIDVCIKHLENCIEYKGQQGLYEFRKHYSGYLRGMFGATNVRQKLVVSEEINDIKKILSDYYDYLVENDRLSINNHSEIPKVQCRR